MSALSRATTRATCTARNGPLAPSELRLSSDGDFSLSACSLVSPAARRSDVKKALAAKASTQKRIGMLQTLFESMDVKKQGTVDLPDFLNQARNAAEAEELQATFEDFDKLEGGPGGTLTFRKFATGTLMQTPLGKMRDDVFEQTVDGMIELVRSGVALTTSAAGRVVPTPPPPLPKKM